MEEIKTLRRKYVNPNNAEKTCKKCEKTYPMTLDFFYPVSKTDPARGLYPRCIKCENERSHQWRNNNREKKRLKDIRYKSSEKGFLKSYGTALEKAEQVMNLKALKNFLNVGKINRKYTEENVLTTDLK